MCRECLDVPKSMAHCFRTPEYRAHDLEFSVIRLRFRRETRNNKSKAHPENCFIYLFILESLRHNNMFKTTSYHSLGA